MFLLAKFSVSIIQITMNDKYKEPTIEELNKAKKIRHKVEICLDNFFHVLCEEQGHDAFELALAILIYAQEEIFQQENHDKAYFLINQTTMAVYVNQQDLDKNKDLLIDESIVATKEIH